jgi:ankyrin repeat protein
MSRATPPSGRRRRSLWISTILGLILLVFACLFYRTFQRKQQTVHLSEAVRKNDKVQVRALLAQGADPNAAMDLPSLGLAEMLRIAFHLSKPRTHGTTIFMYAAGHCNSAIVQSLLDAGGDVHDQTSSGTTALNIAAGTNLCWYPNLNQNVVLLVEHGADVNHSDKYGVTPLSHAADDPENLTYLLAHGADPNRADLYGITPLIVASALDNSASTRALLQAGANINALTSDGTTALMGAAGARHFKIVLLLLQSGADATIRDQKGRTAEDTQRRSTSRR